MNGDFRTIKVRIKGTDALDRQATFSAWYKSCIGEVFEVRDGPRINDGPMYCIATGPFQGRYIVREDAQIVK